MPSPNRKLIVDTDVASYVFKWHPEFAPRYIHLLQGAELFLSFMSVAEGGASQANWGTRQRDLLEQYIADFAVLHSDNSLCSWWAEVKTESRQKGRPMGSADAWIAATALALSVPLVTNNAKDYQHLDGLQIVSLTPA